VWEWALVRYPRGPFLGGLENMKQIILSIMLLVSVAASAKEVDYVTVKVCRDLFFGKYDESTVQAKVNSDLKAAINKVSPSRVIAVQYGNDESGLFRDKKNACIVATAWYEK
jgi:hypothetical protein